MNAGIKFFDPRSCKKVWWKWVKQNIGSILLFLLLYGTNLYCVPSLLDHTTMFNFSPFNHALLDLQQLMEASYEIWFVHPVCLDILLSICLSGCFLGIKSLVFSKFWHIVKNPYEDEYNIAGSLEGKHLPQNLGKWTKYETKNVFFFQIYWKIL